MSALPHAPQRGFTIIELMVAMLIGIFLMIGIVSVFTTSARTYQTRDGLSMMQENGRIAIKRLQRGLSPAGYPTYQNIPPVLLQNTDGEFTGIALSSDSNNRSGDTVTIVHRQAPVITNSPNANPIPAYSRDCLGNTVNEALVTNTFFVDAATSTLQCRGRGNNGAQAIAEGVESMQVLYGMDNNDDGFADHYLNATDVNTVVSGDANKALAIVSIRVALLVNSQELARDTRPGQGGGGQFSLLDVQLSDVNDFLQRRVFTTTIPLRNRMPL